MFALLMRPRSTARLWQAARTYAHPAAGQPTPVRPPQSMPSGPSACTQPPRACCWLPCGCLSRRTAGGAQEPRGRWRATSNSSASSTLRCAVLRCAVLCCAMKCCTRFLLQARRGRHGCTAECRLANRLPPLHPDVCVPALAPLPPQTAVLLRSNWPVAFETMRAQLVSCQMRLLTCLRWRVHLNHETGQSELDDSVSGNRRLQFRWIHRGQQWSARHWPGSLPGWLTVSRGDLGFASPRRQQR